MKASFLTVKAANSLLRPSLSTASKRFTSKLCIVGGGPAGFYAAQHLIKAVPNCEVDVLERLPIPFGLVRYGVAPDHPEVKNVINTFTKTALSPQVHFAGNINFGTDVTLKDLKEAYHAVILTYGAEEDNTLGVPGENLKNVLSARRFVGWYNGVPSDRDFEINLDTDVAIILGQGNVAIDAARMLLTPVDLLKTTDITEYALAKLATSQVRTVYLVGRRGPLQVAFTIKELREMLKLKDCHTIFEKEHFQGVREAIPKLERPRKRLTELLVRAALDTTDSKEATPRKDCTSFRPLFLRSPLRFMACPRVPDEMAALELAFNTLEGDNSSEQRAVPTGKTEVINGGLALRSIGYRGVQADPDLPFDAKLGRVKNARGRVEKGVYAAGWLATGPTGVILSTMSNAFETGAMVAEDVHKKVIDTAVSKPGFAAVSQILKNKGVQIVTFKDWERIDHVEQERGRQKGKPREKIVDVKEMLQIADNSFRVLENNNRY